LFIKPKITATYDVGSSSLKFKDGYFSGTVSVAALTASGALTVGALATLSTVDINGGNIDGTVLGAAVPAAATVTTLAATTATVGGVAVTTATNTQTLTNKTISGGTISGITDLAVADGGTGGSTPTAAQAGLGIPPDDNGNRIINGDFGIWQRGLSSSLSAYGSADRWAHFYVGGTTTTSRQAHTLGDQFGASTPLYFLRQSVSGQTGSNFASVQQRVEGVNTYAGQTITIMGWAKRFSGTGNLGVRTTQSFGTGGSPSADVASAQQIVTLTGSWAPFAATISVPSVTGKTLGSSGNDYLSIIFDSSDGTRTLGIQTIAVDLFGIHIRPGVWTAADAALYVPRDLGTETALCQRYLFKTQLGVILRGYSPSAGAQTFQTIVFPVTMRGGVIATDTWANGANNLSQTVTTSATQALLTLTSIIGSDFAVQYVAGNSFDSEL
jgi:hypothetical protein